VRAQESLTKTLNLQVRFGESGFFEFVFQVRAIVSDASVF
jgi:hypothetical protein